MKIETDAQGRLPLPEDFRERYGEQFHLLEHEDRLVLIPIADDPLRAVREAVGDAFEGKSIAELREETLEGAAREARKDLERS